jgi:ubiquinone/menaquinone biosynthesis C-methylase UbiE
MFEIPVIFKCPLRKMTDYFNTHISDTHLDVGVGTGYFLDKGKFPVSKPSIHLLDLNRNCLMKTSRRIARYNPVQHLCSILEPIQEDMPSFNSISAMNFLHCLPGTMQSKEAVFANLKPFLSDMGVFFGITVLGEGVELGPLYRYINSVYNKKKIFSNLSDNRADLEQILKNHFREYSVEVEGSMALFYGRCPVR